jgi:hypothetical protein
MSLAVLLIGMWASLRARSVDDAVYVQYLTCLLCSPLGWVYYHWILAGPGLATFRQYDRRFVYAACAGFLVPFFFLAAPSVPFAVTAGSLYTWSTLALWGVAVGRATRVASGRRDGAEMAATRR